jgi:hypothetical protein
MKWQKRGRIFEPRSDLPWNRSYAMMPTADHVENDIFRVYFSGRDSLNRSLIGFILVDLVEARLLDISEKPALGLGELGCFDDNGVTPSSIVNHKGCKYLFYCGWKPRSTVRFGLMPGLAVSCDDGTSFSRASRSPVLQLTNEEPFSILTAPFVLRQEEKWHMWYVSGTGWNNADQPRYNIKYAISEDGVRWKQTNTVCIRHESEEELALGRPCVLHGDGLYRMWYSYKSQAKNSYQIGYAESMDGLVWERLDNCVGINVSKNGWDSEMIEYAFVLRHKNRFFMLYNGNNYGENGFGLAIADF